MAPPKPAPIAAPRRGKFLSPPSASSPSSSTPNTTSSPSPGTAKTRGKFLGKNPSSTSASIQASTSFGSNAAGGDHTTGDDSRESLKAHIHTSKIAAASRRKTIAAERDRVMNDLDEAENIVLSLLECASDLSTKLSGMTTSKSRKRHGAKRDEDNEGSNNAEESFEELTAGVRSNNVGYLAGVKKLHKLLAPHAELVKSYKNHGSGDRSTSESEMQSSKTSIAEAMISGASDGRQKRTSSKIVEEATSNMYAARVKKRLAVERSEILAEMIRLEELEDVEEGSRGNDSNVKSESMEMDDTKE